MASVKMSDVAKAAGVSIATVGRVIHNNGYVAEEKRVQIENIIKQLGYVPNKMAQGLKSNQSKIIGHMTMFNTNMLFEQISAAVDAAAANNGYHVMTLTNHMGKNEEERQLEDLIGHKIDGVIFTSNLCISKDILSRLTGLRIPVVMVERAVEMPFVDRILVNDFEGSYHAVKHIIERGHSRIGFIGKQLTHEVEINRYEGYRKALSEARLKALEDNIRLTHEYSVKEGYKAIEEILKSQKPPTAIFMTSDIFACGVMQYLYEKGIRVPEEISLVGYDNTLATLLAPPITSVGLPFNLIGEYALEMLLSRMADMETPAQTIGIDTILIDRGTVRDLRDSKI